MNAHTANAKKILTMNSNALFISIQKNKNKM